MHEISRNFRRNSRPGQGRGRRGNGNTNTSAKGNKQQRRLHVDELERDHMLTAPQVEQAVDAAEAAATKLEEEEDVVEMT